MGMQPAVIVYLDIDGPLAPFATSPQPELSGWTGEWASEVRCGPYTITYSLELIARLNTLAADPRVGMTWLSSWEEHAPQFFCGTVGIAGEGWPVLEGVFGDAREDWWKLRAMQAEVAAMPGLLRVWVDDDLTMEKQPAAVRWAAENGILTVAPTRGVGLSREDLETLENFVSTASNPPTHP